MRQKHFSALAGGVALAIMMVPTIARTTEQMLLLVPQSIREAAYGLGVSRWRTTLSITLRTATSGVITGVMLAFARVAGETAPLLFTAFGNQFWNWKTDQPTAALSTNLLLCHLSVRRMAPAGMGRSAGFDYSYRGCGGGGSYCRAARNFGGSVTCYGRRHHCRALERVLRQDAGVVRRQHHRGRQSRDGAHRPVGLREINIHSLSESHARNHPRGAGRGERAHRRSQRLQRDLGHAAAPPRRHGVSKTESVPDHVDL